MKWQLSNHDGVKTTVGASPWDTVSTLFLHTVCVSLSHTQTPTHTHVRALSVVPHQVDYVPVGLTRPDSHFALRRGECQIIREYLWSFLPPRGKKKQIWNKLVLEKKKRAEGEKFREVPEWSVCVIRRCYGRQSEQSSPSRHVHKAQGHKARDVFFLMQAWCPVSLTEEGVEEISSNLTKMLLSPPWVNRSQETQNQDEVLYTTFNLRFMIKNLRQLFLAVAFMCHHNGFRHF